jgi:hypothetical protein
MDTGRIFTANQLAEAAQAALENWDWGVEADEGKSEKEVEAMKEALDLTADEAEELWGKEMDLDSAFSNIWDFFYEFAVTAANS